MVSIKDIAKRAGMSPSTVSRVINGKKYVKPEIRQRILDLVEETGYVPNRAARSMVLKRTFTVGIVIPDTFNMFQRQLFSIIEHHLETYGYHTLFFFVKFESASEERCLNRLKSEKLDGVIMLHEIQDPRFYDFLRETSLPTVLSTFERDGSGFGSIHVDERNASKTAVTHLIKLGHQKIDLISGGGFSFGEQRAEGYRIALREANIPVDENRIVFVPAYTPDAGQVGTQTLLERRHEFSALFAATDELAIGAIRALNDAGYRVPQDISVVGFDDIDISTYLVPRLTTIRQPLLELGERTATLVHERISGEVTTHRPIILPYELIIRESSESARAE